MPVDVCILVEGTYPFVTGGVSSWLHALVSNLPELKLAIVHVGSKPDPSLTTKYDVPANVVSIHNVYIHDTRGMQRRSAANWPVRPAAPRCPSQLWQDLRDFHAALAADQPYDSIALLKRLTAPDQGGLTLQDLLYSSETWDLLVEQYSDRASDSSFLDFFWTFRFTHLPLVHLLRTQLPEARIYHSISTGFAGFAGALASLRTGAPFLLTEHGIYTKEREIEIAEAQWIPGRPMGYRLTQGRGLFKEWWINMFRFLTKFAYDVATDIISITHANQRYQLRDGADPKKLRVIPNGIDIHRFSSLRTSEDSDPGRYVVGFVGRVVSIKDVKTFVRAIKIASSSIPELQAYIIGPTDEEPGYFAECRALAQMLGLESILQFTGPVDVRDYYRQIDVLVLTSLSEAQPLVILEANCAGIPVVATDVGACDELLNGISPEDRALGPSGLLTPVASPQDTGSALIQLWRDPGLRQRMAKAGQERVPRFYREEALYSAYRSLYQGHLRSAQIAATE